MNSTDFTDQASLTDVHNRLNYSSNTLSNTNNAPINTNGSYLEYSGDEEEDNSSDNDSKNLNSHLPFPNYPKTAFYLSQTRHPRDWCLKIISWPWFEQVSIAVILVNCVTLGMYRPCIDHDCNNIRCQILAWLDHFIFGFFFFELVVKFFAMGLLGPNGYLKDCWNKLDMFIVVAGLIEYIPSVGEYSITSIRTIRVLRPLRAINRIPSMRILVILLLDTLPMLGNVLLLCFFVFFIFGIVGVQMWQGLLRNRCYLQLNESIRHPGLNLSDYYIINQTRTTPLAPLKEFICSKYDSNGILKCNAIGPSLLWMPNNRIQVCNESAKPYSDNLPSNTSCVNWNQYYTDCRPNANNPYFGAINFDNIGFAWVAIFQVISMESWVDIMYYVQDAHSYWDWIYFVSLIIIGSFFMVNLCLVVIATQFSETKKRETERMWQERKKQRSTSTLGSSVEPQSCYHEIIKMIRKLLQNIIKLLIDKYYNYAQTHQEFANRFNRIIPIAKLHANQHKHRHRSKSKESHEEPLQAQMKDNFHLNYPLLVKPPDNVVSMVKRINGSSRSQSLSSEVILPTNSSMLLQIPSFGVQMITKSNDKLSQDPTNPNNNHYPIKIVRRASWNTNRCVKNDSFYGNNNTNSNIPQLTLVNSYGGDTGGIGNLSNRMNKPQTPVKQTATCNNTASPAVQFKNISSMDGNEFDSENEEDEKKSKIRGLASRFQQKMKQTVAHRYFQRSILLAILVNTLSMGIEYHKQPPELTETLEYSNLFFNGLFLIEMVLKIMADGIFGYISNGFNVFDGGIVILGFVEIAQEGGASGLSVLRTFRLLRILKLIRFMPALRQQFVVMLKTMDNVATFFALLILFIFIFSVLGMSLFGCKFCKIKNGQKKCDRKNFDSLLWAIVTVFQILTQEDWNAVLISGMSQTSAWAALYFVALMTFGNYVLFNLLVAILVEGFSTDRSDQSSEDEDEEKSELKSIDEDPTITKPEDMITKPPEIEDKPENKDDGDSDENGTRMKRKRSIRKSRKESSKNNDDFSQGFVGQKLLSGGTGSMVPAAIMTPIMPIITHTAATPMGSPRASPFRELESLHQSRTSIHSDGVSLCVPGFHPVIVPNRCSSRTSDRRDSDPSNIVNGLTLTVPKQSPSPTLFLSPSNLPTIDRGSPIPLPRPSPSPTTLFVPPSSSPDLILPIPSPIPRTTYSPINTPTKSHTLGGVESHPRTAPNSRPRSPSLQLYGVPITFSEYSSNIKSPRLIQHAGMLVRRGSINDVIKHENYPLTNPPPNYQFVVNGNCIQESKKPRNRSTSNQSIKGTIGSGSLKYRNRHLSTGGGRSSFKRFRNNTIDVDENNIQNITNLGLGDCVTVATSNNTIVDSVGGCCDNNVGSRRSSVNSIHLRPIIAPIQSRPVSTNLNIIDPSSIHNNQSEYVSKSASNLLIPRLMNNSNNNKNNNNNNNSTIEALDSPAILIDHQLNTSNIDIIDPYTVNIIEEAENKNSSLENENNDDPDNSDDEYEQIPCECTWMFRIHSCFKDRFYHSLYIFSPENIIRCKCQYFMERKWFDNIILFFIALNCITLAMERPSIPDDSLERRFLHITNYVFTIIFTVEMMVKVISKGLIIGHHSYLHSGWNFMDGLLVIISVTDILITIMAGHGNRIFGILKVFRLLRTLRPLRVISRAPGLKLVVLTLLSSLRPIGNILLICCTFFIIFGILGVQLFKGKFYYCIGPDVSRVKNRTDCMLDPRNEWRNQQYNFDDLGSALMSLFVLASKDGWVQIMYTGLDAVGVDQQPQENYNEWYLLYFISFLLLVGFFVLNMFVGVVVENFHKCRESQEKEEKARRAAKRARKLEKRKKKLLLPPYWEHYPKTRMKIHNLVNSKYFDLAIAGIIGLNVITMAMEFHMMPDVLNLILKILNYVFTFVFIVEAIIKVVALGYRRYIRDRWNQLDILIVILSVSGIVIEKMHSTYIPINVTIIRVFRVLRIARVLKLLKMAKGIRALLDTVIQALPQVGNLALLFFLLFFIFAALGVELFGRLECSLYNPCLGLSRHAHFENFGMAFLTLFRIATGDNWNGIMKDTLRTKCNNNYDCHNNCCASPIISPVYFVVFVLMAQFVLVNVVVAVLMKHLEESHKMMCDDDEIEKEVRKEIDDEKKEIQVHINSENALLNVPINDGSTIQIDNNDDNNKNTNSNDNNSSNNNEDISCEQTQILRKEKPDNHPVPKTDTITVQCQIHESSKEPLSKSLINPSNPTEHSNQRRSSSKKLKRRQQTVKVDSLDSTDSKYTSNRSSGKSRQSIHHHTHQHHNYPTTNHHKTQNKSTTNNCQHHILNMPFSKQLHEQLSQSQPLLLVNLDPQSLVVSTNSSTLIGGSKEDTRIPLVNSNEGSGNENVNNEHIVSCGDDINVITNNDIPNNNSISNNNNNPIRSARLIKNKALLRPNRLLLKNVSKKWSTMDEGMSGGINRHDSEKRRVIKLTAAPDVALHCHTECDDTGVSKPISLVTDNPIEDDEECDLEVQQITESVGLGTPRYFADKSTPVNKDDAPSHSGSTNVNSSNNTTASRRRNQFKMQKSSSMQHNCTYQIPDCQFKQFQYTKLAPNQLKISPSPWKPANAHKYQKHNNHHQHHHHHHHQHHHHNNNQNERPPSLSHFRAIQSMDQQNSSQYTYTTPPIITQHIKQQPTNQDTPTPTTTNENALIQEVTKEDAPIQSSTNQNKLNQLMTSTTAADAKRRLFAKTSRKYNTEKIDDDHPQTSDSLMAGSINYPKITPIPNAQLDIEFVPDTSCPESNQNNINDDYKYILNQSIDDN